MNIHENIKRIKEVMGLINESVINPNDSDMEKLSSELKKHIESSFSISYNEFKTIAEKYGIEVVTYDEFISDYPKEYLKDVPSFLEVRTGGDVLGMVNPVTNNVRLIFADEEVVINGYSFSHLMRMIKHEFIHLKQALRKKTKKSGEYYGDSKDYNKYFTNKDEIMAFANTIVLTYLSYRNPNDFESAKKDIERHLKIDPTYKIIKNNVDEKTLNRYKKYIYLYLEQEFNS